MGAIQLQAWDATNSVWRKVLCNDEGKLIIDPTEIFEDTPTDNEHGKAPTSDWAYEHEHNNTDPHGSTLNQTTLNVGTLNITGASRVRVTRNTAQSIPSGAYTKIQFNVIGYDNLGEFDYTTNYEFTADADGYYAIMSQILFDSTSWAAGNYILLLIYVNNAMYCTLNRRIIEAALTAYHSVQGSNILFLNSGDTLDIRVIHTRGSNTNLYAGNAYNYLCIHRLS